jgi:hypothetical protein
MNAVEFETTLTQAGQIALPTELLDNIPAGQQLRVVVMWQAGAPDTAWQLAGRQCFEQAYSAEDSVYEQLIDDSPHR